MTGEALRIRGMHLRRWLFGGAVALATAAGTWLMIGIVGSGGFSPLEALILALFVPTFAWIVAPFWTSTAGFLLLLFRRDPLTLRPRGPDSGDRDEGDRPPPALSSLTALVVPVFHENPVAVMARLSAIARSLQETGEAHRFHFHILSDTRDPAVARAEESAWARLQGTHPEMVFLYRRRDANAGRKAGNIGEFLERCGGDYDFMVVLDADSVMSGRTLVRLARQMEANPRAGLIQTVPLPARQETLLGRIMQFAASIYAPVLAAGQAFWQGDAANYWGHNAILRVASFREHAQLPVLPGRAPWGGEILSHDFVEAALLRRAGWEVLLDAGAGGSWEELPTNLVDYARRDRRWAQGSIQHLRLLTWPGLHPLSRVHFIMGAMGYVASLLWLLILVAGTVYVFLPGLPASAALGHLIRPPVPVSLLVITGCILFLPKVLGLVLALRDPARFGGAARLLAGALLETAFSVLLAPVMMVHHSRFVLEIALGRSVDWNPQVRDGEALPWRSSFRAAGPAFLAGLVWTTATVMVSPSFLVWMSPILAGLLVAPVLVRVSGCRVAGDRSRRWGLFLTPAECAPPATLAAVDRALAGDLSAGTGVHASPAPPEAGAESTEGERMYNAERGLFELRRGRPLLINGSDGGALVASVEGMRESALRELEGLGGAAPRLVVTRHRAAAMGLVQAAPDPIDASAGGGTPGPDSSVTFCLTPGTSSETLLQFAAGRSGPWAESAPVVCPQLEAEVAGLGLARLGQMLPAVVAVPVGDLVSPALGEALSEGAILQVGVAEIDRFIRDSRSNVARVSEAPVPLSEAENSRFVLYRESCGLGEHVAILVGSEEDWPDPVPVRLHSACLTGDLFGSLRCDCGEQLRGSMEYFASQGGGVLLYLAQEGRGIGLGNKFRAYTLQETGLDTIDADGTLGFGADERRYDVAVRILHDLGVRRIELLTNNPDKVGAVEAAGLEVVSRRPLHGHLNRHNLPYVRAKVDRAGHWLHSMLRQGVSGD